MTPVASAVADLTLPDADAWRAAAAAHPELFTPLAPDARIGLIARAAPDQMLVWEVKAVGNDTGVTVSTRPFPGFADCGMDVLLAADAAALERIRAAAPADLFRTMRADVRSGELICYMLSRRCELEVQGFEPVLDGLGFVFMGACR